ncbi:MAG: class I SAM-dependent methyltransferase [Gemmatimonadota bacterium]|nr:MAG: class I SAM-dependent methyltransferase [Gemmatimonadota bacterium]
MHHPTQTLRPARVDHFSAVARRYRTLRDLDLATVRHVTGLLAERAGPGSVPLVLDIGSGTGRYIEAVIETTAADRGLAWQAVACDASRFMVSSGHVTDPSLNRVVALAEALPFQDESFDAVLSFNAVHHFQLEAFLGAAARALRHGGLLLVYTRTPEQNTRTVWGRFFPDFAERETRLYTEQRLRATLACYPQFRFARLEERPWRMRKTLGRLIQQARGRCYSTFSFYTPTEFELALQTFRRRVAAAYPDPSNISVRNDHLLLVAPRY